MHTRLLSICGLACLVFLALPTSLLSHRDGSALSFDGSDDYVEVPDDNSLDMTNGFTVAAWIFLDSYTEWASLVTKGGINDGSGDLGPNNFTIHQSGPSAASGQLGHLRFSSDLGLAGDSHSIITLREWHHIAVTFDGATLRFYLDGRPDGEIPFAGPLNPNDASLHIGADFPGDDEYWHGRIDELKIWNSPLKQAHIRAAMRGHSSPLAKALVGFWRFDEGRGNIAHDRSRKKNDGVLVNNPTWVSPGAPLGDFDKVTAEQPAEPASELVLMSNYPNPFNPETEIRFQLPEADHVVLKILNVLGAEIRTLTDDQYEAGFHRVRWNGKDNAGRAVVSGLYLYRIQTDNFSQVKKMNLLR